MNTFKELLEMLLQPIQALAAERRASVSLFSDGKVILRAGDQNSGCITIADAAQRLDLVKDNLCTLSRRADRPQVSPNALSYPSLSLEQAVKSFRLRRQAAKGKQIKNDELYAGSPMYFYCKDCGVPVAILNEDWLDPPPDRCEQCSSLPAEVRERLANEDQVPAFDIPAQS
jgi:hypothetical protein